MVAPWKGLSWTTEAILWVHDCELWAGRLSLFPHGKRNCVWNLITSLQVREVRGGNEKKKKRGRGTEPPEFFLEMPPKPLVLPTSLNKIQNAVATRLGVEIRESKVDVGWTVMGERVDAEFKNLSGTQG